MAHQSLLQSLKDAPSGGFPNLASQLEAALPRAQLGLLRLVVAQAEALDLPIYVVGGVVRDLLLERPIVDFDLVVEGDAIKLGRRLAKQYGGKLTAHKRFGTAVWDLSAIQSQLVEQWEQPAAALPDSLDLISARKESYAQPGALPKVEPSSIEEDLKRRDFSINTLALRLDGEHYGQLVDPWGGLADLLAGRLRVLHARSFVDDPTRILRILRFAGRLDFAIGPESLDWLYRALPGLGRISMDRIRHELDAILLEDRRVAILRLASEYDALTAIHPGLLFGESGAASLAHLPAAAPDAPWHLEAPPLLELGYLLWFQHLTEAIEIAVQLKLPQSTLTALAALQRLPQELAGLATLPPSQATLALEQAPMAALYAAYIESEDEAAKELIERYVRKWQGVKPVADGHELRRRGLAPGPAYSQILAALRAAWLDGEINSAEEESQLLDRLIADHDG